MVKKSKETITRQSLMERIIYKKNTLYFMFMAFLFDHFAFTGILSYAADPATDADAVDKWDEVIKFIKPWISRLGGLVIVIGIVDFGLSFKNDDAEGKTRGIKTIVAGCIVFAAGLVADNFLY